MPCFSANATVAAGQRINPQPEERQQQIIGQDEEDEERKGPHHVHVPFDCDLHGPGRNARNGDDQETDDRRRHEREGAERERSNGPAREDDPRAPKGVEVEEIEEELAHWWVRARRP